MSPRCSFSTLGVPLLIVMVTTVLVHADSVSLSDGSQVLGTVQTMIDGSLEADRDPAPTYALLKELPSPTSAEIRQLKERVVHELEHPKTTPGWVPWVALAGGGLVVAALGWWLLA